MGRKLGSRAPLRKGDLGPQLTQCDQGETSMPSFILIHPTVWPQYTNVTDRQTGQDRQTERTDRQTTDRWHRANRFWATVCKTVRLCYQTVVCLSVLSVCLSVCPVLSVCLSCPVCLSVTLVYCGQTVGCIKMKLGLQVGLGPEHTVLDRDPAPPPKKGAEPPIFGACLLWPNGWMDQDATWYGCRPRPRQHCVRWGSSPPKWGTTRIFGACLLWPNGCMYQNMYATWYGVGLSLGDIVLPSSPSAKEAQPPNFRPMSVVAKRLDGLRCHMVWR